jgi:hypothetical protein
MEALELINIICPEHNRTSCSDDYISNGFCYDETWNSVKNKFENVITDNGRCTRCELLELESGFVVNKNNIPLRF